VAFVTRVSFTLAGVYRGIKRALVYITPVSMISPIYVAVGPVFGITLVSFGFFCIIIFEVMLP